jgi:hypothetical protein
MDYTHLSREHLRALVDVHRTRRRLGANNRVARGEVFKRTENSPAAVIEFDAQTERLLALKDRGLVAIRPGGIMPDGMIANAKYLGIIATITPSGQRLLDARKRA